MFNVVPITVLDSESRPSHTGKYDAERVVRHIRTAMASSRVPLTETDIWLLLAKNTSQEWRETRKHLAAAQHLLDDHLLPENRPIGKIGIALDGDTTTLLEDGVAQAMADFTLIDEDLRNDPELIAILDVLARDYRLAHASKEISEDILRLTQSLAVSSTKEPGFLGRTFRLFSKQDV